MSSRIYIKEKFPPSNTININGFEFKIVYPSLTYRAAEIFVISKFVMSNIEYLINKINSKHCV